MDVRRKGTITPELATEYLAGAVLLGAAFATTVGVLTEVPVMLALCWFAFFGRGFDDNWGLEDPTGKSDEEFKLVIGQIEKKILELKKSIISEK